MQRHSVDVLSSQDTNTQKREAQETKKESKLIFIFLALGVVDFLCSRNVLLASGSSIPLAVHKKQSKIKFASPAQFARIASTDYAGN